MTTVDQLGLFVEDNTLRLLHCDAPMKSKGSTSTWEGKWPMGASRLQVRYLCHLCGALLVLDLTEPDRPRTT